MLNTRAMYAVTAILLAFAVIEPSSANSQGKASALDDWSESKLSFHLASNYRRINETQAACDALTESLDYYRVALAKETNTPVSEFGSGLGNDEGMQEIRSRFGCTR
jgi:hypothetical protein